MPSSLIFAGLVVLWLLILVPAVARRQQEVARLSPAVLSGRVLERPMRHRLPEVDVMERRDDGGATTVGELAEQRDDVPSPRERAEPRERADATSRAEADDRRTDRRGPDTGGRGDAGHDRFSAEHDLDRELDRDFHDGDADHTIDADEADFSPAAARWTREWPDTPAPRTDAPRTDVSQGDVSQGDVSRPDDSGATTTRTSTADAPAAPTAAPRPDDTRPDDTRPDDTRPDTDVPDDEDRQYQDPRSADDAEWDDEPDGEPPVARYRPGRGGFDPEAAEAAAHAKYATRQRVVLGLLVLVLASALLALLVAGVWWWVAGATGLALAGYLTYLRRQVRIEESIRRRRTDRLAGTRRSAAADDPALDGWARRGQDETAGEPGTGEDTAVEDDEDWTADDGEPARVRGTGEPLGVLPARCRTVDGPSTEHESSLPRIQVAPAPPVPAGTSLVDVDDEDQLDAAVNTPEHRRAAGE